MNRDSAHYPTPKELNDVGSVCRWRAADQNIAYGTTGRSDSRRSTVDYLLTAANAELLLNSTLLKSLDDFSVRQFSITVRTMWSGAPRGSPLRSPQ